MPKRSPTLFFLALTCALPLCYADETIKTGKSINDFPEFFASGNAIMRDGRNEVPLQLFRYELRQGEKIDGGCRFVDVNTDEWAGHKAVLTHEVAHDYSECQRLFLIGVPYPDSLPEWINIPRDRQMIEGEDSQFEDVKSSGDTVQTQSEITECETNYLKITDGNEPNIIKPIRELLGFEGIPISTSSVWAQYRTTTPSTQITGCGTAQYGNFWGGTSYSSGGIGWEHSYEDISCPYTSDLDKSKYCFCTNHDEYSDGCFVRCPSLGVGPHYARAGVSAVLTNSDSLLGFFDCSADGGAKITVDAVSVESKVAGEPWEKTRVFSITGPQENCLENIFVSSVSTTDDCDS